MKVRVQIQRPARFRILPLLRRHPDVFSASRRPAKIWRMPNRSSAVIAGAPVAPDCSVGEPTGAPDEPDQRSRGFFGRLFDRIVPPTALVRFLGYVRPHLWLVAGGSIMGILKFTLPLAFPLAFKYVFDVLLVPQPHPEHLNSMIDGWCR